MLFAPSPRYARVSAGQLTEALPYGLQVGQHLAGMVGVGQRVDHRHAGVSGHGLELVLPERAPDDGGRLAAEHPGDVGDGLPGSDAGQPGVDDQREPAQFGDAGGERGLGAQRRFVEQHGHAARTREGLPGERSHLQLVGEVAAPPPARRS